jgi:hypothetical protein
LVWRWFSFFAGSKNIVSATPAQSAARSRTNPVAAIGVEVGIKLVAPRHRSTARNAACKSDRTGIKTGNTFSAGDFYCLNVYTI